MNFGNIGGFEFVFALLLFFLPLVVVAWFVRTLSAMAASLREISESLASLERSVRDVASQRRP